LEHEGNVLFFIVGIDHDVKAVLLQWNGNLLSVFVLFVDAEILFEGGDHIIFDHELPAAVELSGARGTSLS
jgi:hypothetical protein